MAAETRNIFPTPESLADWLKARLSAESFAAWGIKPGTKNVHNLWIELAEGESTLSESTPPIRTVHCAVVRILSEDNKSILLESGQQLTDGTTRHRSSPLAEKMKPGETIEVAALRAVKEELGVVDGAAEIVPGSYKIKEEEEESRSYPGLATRYVVHTVDAHVGGLPEGDFATEEEEYNDCNGLEGAVEKAVHVKKHYWSWADA